MLAPAEPMRVDPVVTPALPGDALDAVAKLDDKAVRVEPSLVGAGLQSTGTSSAAPRANVASASVRNRARGSTPGPRPERKDSVRLQNSCSVGYGPR